MTEILDIDQYIYETLTADATLQGLVGTRIYNKIAPHGATAPFVVFMQVVGSDVNALGGDGVIWSDMLYRVKIVQRGMDAESLRAISARVHTLLEAAVLDFQNNTYIGGLTRETTTSYPEMVGGETFINLVGEYRLTVNQ